MTIEELMEDIAEKYVGSIFNGVCIKKSLSGDFICIYTDGREMVMPTIKDYGYRIEYEYVNGGFISF